MLYPLSYEGAGGRVAPRIGASRLIRCEDALIGTRLMLCDSAFAVCYSGQPGGGFKLTGANPTMR